MLVVELPLVLLHDTQLPLLERVLFDSGVVLLISLAHRLLELEDVHAVTHLHLFHILQVAAFQK